MKTNFKSAMLAAAQLTAAGNLDAATAAIQRALASDLPPAGAPVPWPAARGAQAAGTGDVTDATDVIDVDARWVGAAPDLAGAEARPRADGANGANGANGQMTAGRFSAPAGSREYLLYLPPQANAGSRLSLVVMLHGCTQTPADFAVGTGMNELADRYAFAVLYPAQSKAANPSACWNWFEPRDQRAGQGEPAIIAGMVREVSARLEIPPGRVFVAGLSAGGAMAAILGSAYPELFAAVAVHSGLRAGAAHDLPSALAAMKRGAASNVADATHAAAAAPSRGSRAGPPSAPMRKPVRTIVFHGRQDRTVHPANGRQVIESALAAFPAGMLSSRQESARSPGGRSFVRTVHADAKGVPMVEHWEVQGAGHAWSGGRKAGSHTDPLGPDASAAMAAFFIGTSSPVPR